MKLLIHSLTSTVQIWCCKITRYIFSSLPNGAYWRHMASVIFIIDDSTVGNNCQWNMNRNTKISVEVEGLEYARKMTIIFSCVKHAKNKESMGRHKVFWWKTSASAQMKSPTGWSNISTWPYIALYSSPQYEQIPIYGVFAGLDFSREDLEMLWSITHVLEWLKLLSCILLYVTVNCALRRMVASDVVFVSLYLYAWCILYCIWIYLSNKDFIHL